SYAQHRPRTRQTQPTLVTVQLALIHVHRKHRGHSSGVSTVKKEQAIFLASNRNARMPPTGMARGATTRYCTRAAAAAAAYVE
ncbi:hypothetical protein, partial [Bosea sp. (in: a-proteobacteria)]|uniref:hypothetical protein n=1 Tax=Bosea sp. (in: a-proteobacteria) TaxID=1871050 RepID=UPI0040342A28